MYEDFFRRLKGVDEEDVKVADAQTPPLDSEFRRKERNQSKLRTPGRENTCIWRFLVRRTLRAANFKAKSRLSSAGAVFVLSLEKKKTDYLFMAGGNGKCETTRGKVVEYHPPGLL